MADNKKRLIELMPEDLAQELPFFLQQLEGKPAPKASSKTPQRVKKLVQAGGLQTHSLVPTPGTKWISRMVKFPLTNEG
ncbi:MAG TPA: hypothetical protein DCE41_21790 [Cytophagales bacterium]|nr:hypothetical protein [Cytophagales bacterium]HAA23281.1 hypothetical protein [Cytophagales bacterium]HAP61851.1 hypothetical protein [Cytophagales bacterium]